MLEAASAVLARCHDSDSDGNAAYDHQADRRTLAVVDRLGFGKEAGT